MREFTDLNEESRRTVEKELGETLESVAGDAGTLASEHESVSISSDTLPPGMMDEAEPMNTEIPPDMPHGGAVAPDRSAFEDPAELVEEVAGEASGDLEATMGDAPQAPAREPEEGAAGASETSETSATSATSATEQAKTTAELDPEEEFPDDDDEDFDDDEEEEEDEDEDEEEEEEADE